MGAIDLAHPARADQCANHVGADPRAGSDLGGARIRLSGDGGVAERSVVTIAGEQRLDFLAQRRIVPARIGEERVSGPRVECACRVKELGDLPPALRCHDVGRPVVRSHARATCHSRSTVATEMFSAWPVSSSDSPPKDRSFAT